MNIMHPLKVLSAVEGSELLTQGQFSSLIIRHHLKVVNCVEGTELLTTSQFSTMIIMHQVDCFVLYCKPQSTASSGLVSVHDNHVHFPSA